MAKQITMTALCSLLSLFIAGLCAPQTNNATQNGGPWILTAADADGGSARAYLANTATGDTFNCRANYVWLDTTISEVVCRPFDIKPRSTSHTSRSHLLAWAAHQAYGASDRKG